MSFSNAAAGYFRSKPATYRTQAKVVFDQNGGDGDSVERIVPINQKAYEAMVMKPTALKEIISCGWMHKVLMLSPMLM